MCEINNEEIFYLAILKLNAISRGEENKPPETGESLPDEESADEESATNKALMKKVPTSNHDLLAKSSTDMEKKCANLRINIIGK